MTARLWSITNKIIAIESKKEIYFLVLLVKSVQTQ